MSSSPVPIPPTVQRILNIYINNLPALFATRYVAAAALVIVVYDWLLTLGDECRLIYPGHRSLIKTLYITVSGPSATIRNTHIPSDSSLNLVGLITRELSSVEFAYKCIYG